MRHKTKHIFATKNAGQWSCRLWQLGPLLKQRTHLLILRRSQVFLSSATCPVVLFITTVCNRLFCPQPYTVKGCPVLNQLTGCPVLRHIYKRLSRPQPYYSLSPQPYNRLSRPQPYNRVPSSQPSYKLFNPLKGEFSFVN
jgi:hypothetical protein